MKQITIYIDSDASGLGPDATQADLDQYAENLATHIAERFPGRDVTVTQALGGGPRGYCPDDEDIADYMRDLESGDDWTELLGSAVGSP